MTDFLPDVRMNVEEEVEAPKDEEVDNTDIEEEQEVEEDAEDAEEALPEVQEKKKLDPQTVFKPKQQKIPARDTTPIVYKTKRPLSEKQKAHLAKAREAAREKRERNKKLKEEGRQAELTLKEQREQKVAERVAKKIPQTVHNTTNINNTITEEEIVRLTKKATAEALEKYDTERKKRKSEKQERLKTQNETKRIQQTIARATGRRYGEDGFFADCF
jgi:hypothetical protein